MNHIAGHELLMEHDGELESARAAEVRLHLSGCAECRARQAALAHSLGRAVDEYLEQDLPPIDGARAILHSHLQPLRPHLSLSLGALAAAVLLLVFQWSPDKETTGPSAALTPGAIRAVDRVNVCAASEHPAIAYGVALEVFRRYGIHDPPPRAYEVDYLIPPDLGGSEDPRNLWPQPYNTGTWNARVKDALEDRLRSMVCNGNLELHTAQREIAANWIGAYKKYFRTNAPLPDHLAFVKDRPWE